MNLKWILFNKWKHKLHLIRFRASLKKEGVKRFPVDYTHAELAALVVRHRDAHAEIATKYSDTLEKLKDARKELSSLKRNK